MVLVKGFRLLNKPKQHCCRFAFLLVPDMAECEKIVSKLHRAKFKDRLLIVQASYENTEKRTPQESKVSLYCYVFALLYSRSQFS